jgi:hypothetical protein
MARKAKKSEPDQPRLEGMQDPEIEEIETAARSYAKARDKRMACTLVEVEEQANLLQVMKKQKRTSYKHGDIEAKIVIEKEKVKVKIKKDEE